MSRRGWRTRVPVVAGLVLAWPAAAAGVAAGATGVPYTDPSAAGFIGLCDQAGQQVTSGSIDTTPFAWRAVSSVPAPPPYNNTGRTAVLVAYQPQQELPPGDWSGEQLTASSRYSNPTSPMAAATGSDTSLQSFLQDYPPKWDGFVELRMYLGTNDAPSYQEKYPVLNIRVTGSTWHAVGGGTVNCASGTAESIETALLPQSTTTTAPTVATQPAGAGASAAGGSTGSGASSGSAPTSPTASGAKDAGATATATGNDGNGSHGSTGSGGATQEAASTSSTPVGLVVGIVAAVVVLAAAAWLLLVRRRRTGRTGSTTGPGPGDGPASGGAPEPVGGPLTDVGDEPASEHDLATRQKAATKGEPR